MFPPLLSSLLAALAPEQASEICHCTGVTSSPSSTLVCNHCSRLQKVMTACGAGLLEVYICSKIARRAWSPPFPAQGEPFGGSED